MANNPEKVINTANDLYISINDELRPWSDVSQDIIEYLKNRVETLSQSLIYRGTKATFSDLQAVENPSVGDMYNVEEQNNANYAWNGTEWDSLGPMTDTIDEEAIEGSPRAIQSGFVYKALKNYATYSDIQAIIDEVFGLDSVMDITRNVNQQLSDISQDISDIQEYIQNYIPDPLISTESDNGIKQSEYDGGLYCKKYDSDITAINASISTQNATISDIQSAINDIQNNTSSTISNITTIEGQPIDTTDTTTVNIGIDNDNIMYYQVSGNVTLNFIPSTTETDFSTKYLYIKSVDDVNLAVTGGEWAMIQEDPTFYEAGYCLFARVIWIDRRVILETIDVNQMPDALIGEINP